MPLQYYLGMNLLGNGGGLPPIEPNYLNVWFLTLIALIGGYFVYLGWQLRRDSARRRKASLTQAPAVQPP